MLEEAWQSFQYQLDLFMDMNKKLTQELKAAHWRIARFMDNDSAGMRLTADKAFIMVAWTFGDALAECPGVVDAHFIEPPRVWLQFKAPMDRNMVTQVDDIDREGVHPQQGAYFASEKYASWAG